MGLVQLNNNFSKLPKKFSEELIGKWVAILDGKILAHNSNFKLLFKQVKEQGKEKQVLFHKVPTKEVFIG